MLRLLSKNRSSGNIIGEIKMLPKRATGLQNMKTPKTLADLQRLLGMANYSRTYIPKYEELVKPLYDLMDLKNVPENLNKKKRRDKRQENNP